MMTAIVAKIANLRREKTGLQVANTPVPASFLSPACGQDCPASRQPRGPGSFLVDSDPSRDLVLTITFWHMQRLDWLTIAWLVWTVFLAALLAYAVLSLT